jgi:F0F1-type ATP synthase membrane subunit b/b'
MTGVTFFQVFILVDVFAFGILVALATRYAIAHINTRKELAERNLTPVDTDHLPSVIKERLLQLSQEDFQQALKTTADILQNDLASTAKQINTLVNHSATEIVGHELESYRLKLAQLQKQAEADMGNIKKTIEGHEAEIKTQITKELEAEKQRLINQIDTKLSDAVGSFLVETLRHNIDLGNQNEYLVALLEEHKNDFINEVSNAS